MPMVLSAVTKGDTPGLISVHGVTATISTPIVSKSNESRGVARLKWLPMPRHR